MAGGDASQMPAGLDPDWIHRKFEAIAQWQREMIPSVANTMKGIANDLRAELPAGFMGPFGGATAPTGWMICDGAAISRTTYAVLFANIGTLWGVGDGSTTFNIPDFRGRVPVGVDAGQVEFDAINEVGGAKTHVLNEAELASHTHTQNAHSHGYGDQAGNNGFISNGTGVAEDAMQNQYDASRTTGSTTAINQNAGGNAAHNNLQPYRAVHYIIKVIGV